MTRSTHELDSSRSPVFFAIALAALVLVFFPAAFLRLVDGDEGYYLLASRLVIEGKVLYRDFFYPQMPLVPHAYALWMKVMGLSWYSGRSFSAFLAVLIGLLTFRRVVSVTGRRMLGLMAVLAYCGSGLCIGWFTPAKTYTLATLLCFASYLVASMEVKLSSQVQGMLCGALLGLAADARLTFLGLGPVLMLGVHRESEGGLKESLIRQGWFLAGLALALSPNLVLLCMAPENYYFDNLGYHSLKSGGGLIANLPQKVEVLKELFMTSPSRGATSVQLIALLVANLCYLGRCLRSRRRVDLAFYLAALYGSLVLLQSPTFVQYYCTPVPFMIVTSCILAGEILDSTDVGPLWRGRLIPVLGLALILYVTASRVDVPRFMTTGAGVQGIANPADWSIPAVVGVSALVDRHAHAGDRVITWWPGYLVESKATIFPGMENHFGYNISRALTLDQRRRYHTTTAEETEDNIRHHRARIVVLGVWLMGEYYEELECLLAVSGYRTVGKVGVAEVYVDVAAEAGY